jgi:hypothetical protein
VQVVEETQSSKWRVPPQWRVFKEDLSLDALDASKAEFPGLVLFSLRAGRQASAPSKLPPESRPLVRAAAARAPVRAP